VGACKAHPEFNLLRCAEWKRLVAEVSVGRDQLHHLGEVGEVGEVVAREGVVEEQVRG
jgi:hypothetical protein